MVAFLIRNRPEMRVLAMSSRPRITGRCPAASSIRKTLPSTVASSMFEGAPVSRLDVRADQVKRAAEPGTHAA